MLLPIDDGPGWIQMLSKLNPLTYLVDAERVLFAGAVTEATVAYGMVASLAVLAIGLRVGIRAMRSASA
ncbi:MAG: hypothetical protein ACRD1K_12165 [Acidimicrobiales bacterium]